MTWRNCFNVDVLIKFALSLEQDAKHWLFGALFDRPGVEFTGNLSYVLSLPYTF